MLLIKCKCGCYMTLKDDIFSKKQHRTITCQNCLKQTSLLDETNPFELKVNLSNSDFEVYCVPDNSTLKTSFEF